MKISYLCTYWGSETQSPSAFLQNALRQGYDGVEINLPDDPAFVSTFLNELAQIITTIRPDFVFIAQQVLPLTNESFSKYTATMIARLKYLTSLKPDAINSHTGKDYYDLAENSVLIKEVEQIEADHGVPIYHEIHRGRFTFHLKTLLTYLKRFPNLKLVGDLSHFCVVSESDLSDQHDSLYQIFPHIRHIHARIGSEQSPQVNHPFAPEWSTYLARYTKWWRAIVHEQERTANSITITAEAGPIPYMQLEPFTQKPLAEQSELNYLMKQYLKKAL